MPQKCEVCGKTLGMFDDGYNVADTFFCESCYRLIGPSYGQSLHLFKTAEFDSYRLAVDGMRETVQTSKLSAKDKQAVTNFLKAYEDKNADTIQHMEVLAVDKKQKATQQSEYSIMLRGSRTVGEYLYIQESSRIWAIRNLDGVISKPHKYEDLISFEVVQNGQSVQSSNAGMVIAGAFLLGALGAVAGAASARRTDEYVTDLRILVKVNDVDEPLQQVVILNSSCAKNSDSYQIKVQQCNQIVAMLEYIKNNATSAAALPAETVTGRAAGERARAIYAFSVADEIQKFRKLADDGIITEDEFQTQKRKLLALEY